MTYGAPHVKCTITRQNVLIYQFDEIFTILHLELEKIYQNNSKRTKNVCICTRTLQKYFMMH